MVKLAVEVVEGALHDAGPFLHAHVVVQRRQAVGVAVEHVQLVGQFVDHQVVAFPVAAGQHAGPRKDHRALLPGFAAVFTVPFVFHAAGVAMALGAEEVVGVEHDLVKTLVPVEVAKVHQWQLRLGGEQQALFLVQFDTGQGREVFFGEEQHAGFPQPLVFFCGDAVEKGQVVAHPLPGFIGNRVLGQQAPATPGAEGPHRRLLRLGFGGAAAEAAAEHADDHRYQRQQDDEHYQQRQVFLDERYVAEEVAQGYEAADPQDGAEYAEPEEARVRHLGDAGDERCEGPQDRQKARQGHGFAAVLVVEIVGFLQVVAAEDFRVGVAEQALPGRSSDHVVGAVTQDGREHQQAAQQYRVHAAACGDGAGDKQQGITRQEGHDHQAGFAKDNQEQNGVDPHSVVSHQHVEVHVEMQDKVERVEIHGGHLCEWPGSAGLCGGFG